MKFLIATVLVLLHVTWAEKLSLRQSVPDYYWRDFDGLVPFDAIKGGNDKNGDDTFIGQFHIFRGDKIVTLTAILTKGSAIGRAPHGGVVTSRPDSDVKILCAQYHEDYKWVSPSSQVSPRCHHVIGGFDDVPHYIGRVTIDNQVLVGKVESKKFPLILRVPTDDGYEPMIYEFEVLTFCY